jgi:hypothetical protein
LDLSDAGGRELTVKWYDPRAGGELLDGSVKSVRGGGKVSLGMPRADVNEDWVILVR